jgi:hypothetical protein
MISYGVDAVDLYRRAAGYVDRLLKGAVVSDLPVQAPVKFELITNPKAAKALGLTVPDKLLAIADESSNFWLYIAAPAQVWNWHTTSVPPCPPCRPLLWGERTPRGRGWHIRVWHKAAVLCGAITRRELGG